MIKKILGKPQNVRLLRENMMAGALVFLLLQLILPFNIDEIHEYRLVYLLAMGVITMASGLIAGIFVTYVLKMPMDPKLPLKIVHRNSLFHYLVNIPLLAAALVTFSAYFFFGDVSIAWIEDGHFTLEHYKLFLYYVSSTGVFMYLGTYVRNRNWHLKYKYEEVSAINALLEQRQQELQMQEEGVGENGNTQVSVCTIKGSTSQSVLEVNPQDILFVESMSNYADVWYIEGDQTSHKTMRITLKQINESLAAERYLVQCHRAFIVNLNFVIAMSNRNTGYQLQLFGTDKQIPVSRTYTPQVKERLQDRKGETE
ncbi:MAG: LytTR family DNA-binding domain-containing protein [Prevotella sp.]|nr:LytTR family DNA-binding domain-containing protein [Prevotella sp.]